MTVRGTIYANDEIWEGNIATGFIETVYGAVFELDTTDDEATKKTEFEAIPALVKGTVSTSLLTPSTFTHTEKLSFSLSTSPSHMFISLDAYGTIDGLYFQIASSYALISDNETGWDINTYRIEYDSSSIVYVYAGLQFYLFGFHIIGYALDGNFYLGYVDKDTSSAIDTVRYTGGPSSVNKVRTLKKNMFYGTYVLSSDGYIGYWYSLSTSGTTFADGTEYYEIDTGTEAWKGLASYKSGFNSFYSYAPIFLGDDGKVAPVTAINSSTKALTYSVKTVESKDWAFGIEHEEYEFVVIVATDGTIAVSDDLFDNYDTYSGPFSSINDIYYSEDTQRIYAIDGDTVYYTEDCYNWVEASSETGISPQWRIAERGFGGTRKELLILRNSGSIYRSSQAEEELTVETMIRSTSNGSLKLKFNGDEEYTAYIRDVEKAPAYEMDITFEDKLVVKKNLMLDNVSIEEF